MLVEQINVEGGLEVLKMRLTQDYISSISTLAKKGNQLILPYDITDANRFVNSGNEILNSKMV